jgi:hypothetical protein
MTTQYVRLYWQSALSLALVILCCALPVPAAAHGITEKDAAFVAQSAGAHIVPFLYLGAKHMVTGYDHLLFLFGVVFFLYRPKDVITYVSLFSAGHSTTLLIGVLAGVHVNAYLVDALIGLSVVYIVFDNLGGFPKLFGFQPSTKLAVLAFGLIHGFGLATKVQELSPHPDGLVANIIAFNVGVELGQLLALGLVLIGMMWWRRTATFSRYATITNFIILIAGFALAEYQLAGYFLTKGA